MNGSTRRLGSILALGISLVVLGAGPASADPATPTNYRSEVVAVEGLGVDKVAIVGGDAFVRLTAVAGMTVVVLGYEGEEYIRYGQDGRVEVNQRSPAKYLNDDRYANVELPAEADASREPRWETVATDGTYSWHDHRTHWMSPTPPGSVLSGGEGSTVPIFDWVLPLAGDGGQGRIIGTLTWVPSASGAPWAIVAFLALLVAAVAAFRLRPALQAVVLLILAMLALVAAIAAIASQPPEGRVYGIDVVGPPVAVALAAYAAFASRSSEQAGSRFVLIGSVALAVWGALRIDVLTRPILPTLLPYGLDRMITAIVLGGATGLAVGIVAAITWQNRAQRIDTDEHPAT